MLMQHKACKDRTATAMPIEGVSDQPHIYTSLFDEIDELERYVYSLRIDAILYQTSVAKERRLLDFTSILSSCGVELLQRISKQNHVDVCVMSICAYTGVIIYLIVRNISLLCIVQYRYLIIRILDINP